MNCPQRKSGSKPCSTRNGAPSLVMREIERKRLGLVVREVIFVERDERPPRPVVEQQIRIEPQDLVHAAPLPEVLTELRDHPSGVARAAEHHEQRKAFGHTRPQLAVHALDDPLCHASILGSRSRVSRRGGHALSETAKTGIELHVRFE